jgi:hypothetical protein
MMTARLTGIIGSAQTLALLAGDLHGGHHRRRHDELSPARTPPGSPSCSPRPSSPEPGHRPAGAPLAAGYVVFVIIELSC